MTQFMDLWDNRQCNEYCESVNLTIQLQMFLKSKKKISQFIQKTHTTILLY